MLKSPSLSSTTARRLFSFSSNSFRGVVRSVPESPSSVGAENDCEVRSFASRDRSGIQRSDPRASSTHSSRGTICSLPSPSDRAAGTRASRVCIESDASQRIAIFGFVVGWITVFHSGCHNRTTTRETITNRRISSSAVRRGCGLRFQETKQSTATPSKTAMPSQRVNVVGLS